MRLRIERLSWVRSWMRNAIGTNFVRYARINGSAETFNAMWRRRTFGYDHVLTLHIAGVRVASFPRWSLRHWDSSSADVPTFDLHEFVDDLEMGEAVLQGFATALHRTYGVDRITLGVSQSKQPPQYTSLLERLGAVRVRLDGDHQRWVWKTDAAPGQERRLSFQQPDYAVFDEGTGVSISLPRVQVGGDAPADYEYVLWRGKEKVGFAGLQDLPEKHYEKHGKRLRLGFLNMTHAVTLSHMLDAREIVATTDGDFEFLQAYARGLLLVAARGCGEGYMHHQAITSVAAFEALGVAFDVPDSVTEEGTFVLAEVHAPGDVG